MLIFMIVVIAIATEKIPHDKFGTHLELKSLIVFNKFEKHMNSLQSNRLLLPQGERHDVTNNKYRSKVTVPKYRPIST